MRRSFLHTPAVLLAAVVLLAACAPRERRENPAAPGWYEFSGNWTATGERDTLHLAGTRQSTIARLNGSLLLSGPAKPGVGFRAEAILFSDTATGMTGRAVWTDENGDQIFSELRGDGTEKGGRVDGTFAGGTGRYAGAAGSYDFTWRFVYESPGGGVQIQAVDLKGRVRAAAAAPGASR